MGSAGLITEEGERPTGFADGGDVFKLVVNVLVCHLCCVERAARSKAGNG